MIDIHIHTNYSDGDKSVAEILQQCAEKNLEYISMTDHNTTRQYQDPALGRNIFHGTIIQGVEMDADFNHQRIEILGYRLQNLEIIENWSQRFFSEDMLKQQQQETRQKFLDICDRKGLVYDETQIPQVVPLNDYITVYIYQELVRHHENISILGDFAHSLNLFIRNGLMNPNSAYYIETTCPKPAYSDVVDVIHQAGGLAFLAHPFEYRLENTFDFIDMLCQAKALDGIECFHPSANAENMNLLEQYARAHHLYISGGSDYHGSKKPDISIGVGRGNLHIAKEYIEQWAG